MAIDAAPGFRRRAAQPGSLSQCAWTPAAQQGSGLAGASADKLSLSMNYGDSIGYSYKARLSFIPGADPRRDFPGVHAMLKPVLAASLTLVAGAAFLTEVLASYAQAA